MPRPLQGSNRRHSSTSLPFDTRSSSAKCRHAARPSRRSHRPVHRGRRPKDGPRSGEERAMNPYPAARHPVALPCSAVMATAHLSVQPDSASIYRTDPALVKGRDHRLLVALRQPEEIGIVGETDSDPVTRKLYRTPGSTRSARRMSLRSTTTVRPTHAVGSASMVLSVTVTSPKNGGHPLARA